MKILFIILLGLCSMLAFSQDIEKAEYFIDSDPGIGLATSISISASANIDQDFALDITGLSQGRHTIFLRVKQENGLWGIVSRKNFYVFDPDDLIIEEVDRDLTAVEYFIDEDPGVGNGNSISVTEAASLDQDFSFNTTGLFSGRHDLYVRAKGKEGLWSVPLRRPFFVTDTTTGDFILFKTDIIAAEYFIDSDPGAGKALKIPLQRTDTTERAWTAATEGLKPGRHSLVIRTQNEDGVWGLAKVNEFFVFSSDCNFAEVDFTFDTVGINTDINLQDLSTNIIAGATYSWDLEVDGSIESTDPQYSLQFEEAGVYPLKLTVENESGCARSVIKDIYVIDNTPAPLSNAGLQRILSGQSLELTAAEGFEYEWSTGETTQSITISEEGEYYVWYSSNGITWRSRKVILEVYEPLSYEVSSRPATDGISNGTASILALETNGLSYEISWSDGINQDLIRNGLDGGNYTITVSTELESVEQPVVVGTIATSEGIVAAEYFIDSDPGPGSGITLTVNQSSEIEYIGSFSTEALAPGKHNLFIRTKAVNGFWGIPKRKSFFVSDETSVVTIEGSGPIVYAEYAIDESNSVGEGIEIPLSASGDIVAEDFSLDVNGLTTGDHTVFLRTKAQNGAWSIEKIADFQVCNIVPDLLVTSDTAICSGGSVNYQIEADAGNVITWYDSTLAAVRQGTDLVSWNLTNVQDTTLYYVTQRNEEGCESALAPFYVIGREIEVFAGSDLNVDELLTTFTLDEQFPTTGGAWSGNFVTEEGVFDVQSAGLGSITTLTYTVDSLGCTVSDEMVVRVVPTSNSFFPELTVSTLELSESVLNINDSLNVSFSFINESPISDALNVEYGVYISNDTILQSFDGLLFSGNLDMMAETEYSFNFKFDLPDTLTFESYNLIVSVDNSLSIIEDNEVDNLAIQLFTVTSSPQFVSNTLSIPENSTNGALIGTLDVTDPDGDLLSFYWADSTNFAFVDLDVSSGDLTVKDSTLFNHEAVSSFLLNLGVTDMKDSTESQITVNIIDENELEADSTILVQLYQSTNGAEWIGADNWLSDEISTWEGLTIVDNRVSGIDLRGFNLSGNVIDLGGLSGISEIDVSNNQITSIDSQSLADSVQLSLVENRLNFDEISKNTSLPNFQFDPQLEVLQQDTLIEQQSTSIDLERTIPGATSYQWKKRDLGTGDISDISATQAVFVLSIANFSSEGAYYVEATSEEVPGLVLTSTPIIVKVSSLERDQLALLAIYDSLNGASWTGNANNWSTDLAITDWGGVVLDDEQSRVIGLNLADQKISGKIPVDILDMRSLQTIDLSGNDITSLPNLTSLPDLNSVNISDNRFDFQSLNNNASLDEQVNFLYAPQKIISNDFSGNYDQGIDVSFNISSLGINNLFTWTLDPLVGENREVARGTGLDSLNLLNIGYSDIGIYYLDVSNSSWPDLTIQSEPIEFNVIADFSVDVNDENGDLIPDNVDGYLLLTTQGDRGFDTLSVAKNQLSSFTFRDVILGDYLISIDSDPEKYVPSYYAEAVEAFEWVDADTVQFRKDTAFQLSMTIIPDPDKLNGVGTLGVTVEEDFGNATGRIDARRRAARRKCGLRRKTGGGRTDNDGFELIAYGETNENGEFEFGFLPEGVYRFFVEYPGIPLNDASFVEFEVGEFGISETDFKLEAFVSEDGIEVTIDKVLGVIFDYFKDLKVYPNPASEVLKISYRHLIDRNVAAQLVDVTGKVFWSKEIRSGYDGYEEINVSDFETGMYILHVYDSQNKSKNVVSYRIMIR